VVKTMTEPTLSPPGPNDDQLDRIASLRSRRAGAAAAAGGAAAKRARRRRRHVAQGSRIIAAGLGATTMFGIVTVLGLDNPVSGADEAVTPVASVAPTPTAPLQAAPPPVQVVIHRVPATAVPTTTVVEATTVSEAVPAAPVQLTANPVVQTITVAAPSQPQASSRASSSASAPAPAPAATTSGSK
jgi:hypothetical protein